MIASFQSSPTSQPSPSSPSPAAAFKVPDSNGSLDSGSTFFATGADAEDTEGAAAGGVAAIVALALLSSCGTSGTAACVGWTMGVDVELLGSIPPATSRVTGSAAATQAAGLQGGCNSAVAAMVLASSPASPLHRSGPASAGQLSSTSHAPCSSLCCCSFDDTCCEAGAQTMVLSPSARAPKLSGSTAAALGICMVRCSVSSSLPAMDPGQSGLSMPREPVPAATGMPESAVLSVSSSHPDGSSSGSMPATAARAGCAFMQSLRTETALRVNSVGPCKIRDLAVTSNPFSQCCSAMGHASAH